MIDEPNKLIYLRDSRLHPNYRLNIHMEKYKPFRHKRITILVTIDKLEIILIVGVHRCILE